MFGFLAPTIVTGKISLHATVRRNITYDEHINHDIQLHFSIDWGDQNSAYDWNGGRDQIGTPRREYKSHWW